MLNAWTRVPYMLMFVVLLVMTVVVSVMSLHTDTTPKKHHYEVWQIDKVVSCDETPSCVVDLSYTKNPKVVKNALTLNYHIEEGDTVYRNCHWEGEERKCFTNFSRNILEAYDTPREEVDK